MAVKKSYKILVDAIVLQNDDLRVGDWCLQNSRRSQAALSNLGGFFVFEDGGPPQVIGLRSPSMLGQPAILNQSLGRPANPIAQCFGLVPSTYFSECAG